MTSQVCMLLNGANNSNIRFMDGLEYIKDFYGDNQQIFDILVANPPFSVKSFKENLSRNILKAKEGNIHYKVLEHTSLNAKEVENAFVERLTHILKPNALAAIILPSSILSNTDKATITAREIILQNFAIHCIVSFGNQTFGTTGTNTALLFLKRFDEPPKKSEILKDSIEAIFNHENIESFIDKEILESYLELQGIPLECYKAFLRKEEIADNELFKSYKEAFDELSEIKKYKSSKDFDELELKARFFDYALEIEREKLIYFALTYNQKTLIIKAPDDTNEQKRFLGFVINKSKNSNAGLQESEGLLSHKDNRNAEDKIAYAIKRSFKGEFYTHENFEKYISYAKTCHLLNFENAVFNKAISLNPTTNNANIWDNISFRLISLAECGEFLGGLWTGKKPPFSTARVIRNTNFSMRGNLKLESEYPELEVESNQLEKRKLEYGDIIIEKSGGSGTQAVGRAVIFNFKTDEAYSFSNFTTRLRVTREDLNPFYLHLILHYMYQQGTTFDMQNGMSGIRNLALNI